MKQKDFSAVRVKRVTDEICKATSPICHPNVSKEDKMLDKKIQIKEGITFHKIETNKFKTNLFATFLTLPLNRETVTKNALLTAVLRRGTKNLNSQEEISKYLEEMYGASFDCGIEKTGDYHTIKFYLELLNNQYLPESEKENLSEKGLNLLLDIVFNPYVEEGSFKKEYVEQEKENLKQIIQGKIDNKANYAYERCIEEMYKNEPYGLYKYGYIEDLENINEKDLYDYYKEIINICKVDIFASGEKIDELQEKIENNDNIKKLNDRIFETKEDNKKEKVLEPKTITDSMDVTQGKLVIGLDILQNDENVSYIAMLYNTILGVGANAKLFQNVREKAGLAYTCGSNYIKRKNNIMIRAGIEIENYEKALEITNEQLEDMKRGNFNEEDIEAAKNLIYATINNIEEEQDTEISYYFGQELANKHTTVQEYKKKIEETTKEQVVELANNISLNTIYFLKN